MSLSKAKLIAHVSLCAAGHFIGFPAWAQEKTAATAVATDDGVGDIIVTAQKREQNLNDVGLTVNAVTADTLMRQGVTNAADLAKIVPGFVYVETPTGSPVYTLRGIGYVDETLSASPAVSVYVDEVPLPFSTMARAAALDLERIEVLKGPQGTLFGENSTGGAFNYIAAKPQSKFDAGFNASFGRFNTVDVQGYVTGPLTDSLKIRVAARALVGDDWQYSYTRNDKLGRARQYQGRMLLDWQPTDRLSFLLNANGWIDKSDTQAPQLVQIVPQVPAAIFPDLLNYPLAPKNNRAADWDSRFDQRRDDDFWQLSLRGNYELADSISLVSITAYEKLRIDAYYEGDGTSFQDFDRGVKSRAHSFFQELRVAGINGPFNWVLGGNYSDSFAVESFRQNSFDASNSELIPGLRFDRPETTSRQNITSKAVFANAEYELTPSVTVKGGARYTKTLRNANVCIADSGNGNYATFFSILSDTLNGAAPAPVLGLGDCTSLDQENNFAPGPVDTRLSEDNISWRAGVDWHPAGSDVLLYANVSQGYKAGTAGTTPTAFHAQNAPITQEKLRSYEAGIKAPLLGRTMQINAAVFHYEYTDKQLLGRVRDPVFGLLFQLINVPKSVLTGAEAEITWRPVRPLTLNIAGTYLDTNIKKFESFNSTGVLANFAGTGLPYSPQWQINSRFNYRQPINDNLTFDLGSQLSYQSASTAGFAGDTLLRIKSRALLDAQIGIEGPDAKWTAQIWGRNITNQQYWTSAVQVQDAVTRYAGRPATYGVSFSWKY